MMSAHAAMVPARTATWAEKRRRVVSRMPKKVGMFFGVKNLRSLEWVEPLLCVEALSADGVEEVWEDCEGAAGGSFDRLSQGATAAAVLSAPESESSL